MARAVMDSFIHRLSSNKWPSKIQAQRRATNRFIDTTEVWSEVISISTDPSESELTSTAIVVGRHWSKTQVPVNYSSQSLLRWISKPSFLGLKKKWTYCKKNEIFTLLWFFWTTNYAKRKKYVKLDIWMEISSFNGSEVKTVKRLVTIQVNIFPFLTVSRQPNRDLIFSTWNCLD